MFRLSMTKISIRLVQAHTSSDIDLKGCVLFLFAGNVILLRIV